MKNQKKWIAAILCTAAVGAGVFWAGSQGYIATAPPPRAAAILQGLIYVDAGF